MSQERKNQEAHALVSALLDWFAAHARDLPWRRTRDPYAIWVSEIMLQQTQVKTVIPYWERWMRELPTIESLAHANADKIHKLWEGLGYYTRVRNMQKAAQEIVESCRRRGDESHSKNQQSAIGNRQSKSAPPLVVSCKFPDTFEAVLALPGIGRYTAGAICSIAFNQPTPILDGNVIRVLTRIYGIATNPREKQTNAQLWQLAEELVTHAHERWGERPREPHSRKTKPARQESRPTNACSHLNQSLMELGALICTPRSPNCPSCPVQKLCVAHKENLQDQLPNLGKREAATDRRFLAFIVERDGKFLVRQRPAGVVNAHLWEFPNAEVGARVCDPHQPANRGKLSGNGSSGPTQMLRLTAPRSIASELGLEIAATKPFRTIKHSITRYRITLEAWRAELAPANGAPVSHPARKNGPAKNKPDRRPALQGEWRTLNQLHQLAFTSAHKKILARLEAPLT